LRSVTWRAIVIALVLATAATALYATRLGSAPRYLGRDEIGFGRQAYSFATTGRDLDGNLFPLFFGEPTYHVGRDPLLIYVTAALLKVFPLSDVLVRLPNALVGVLDIVLMFFIARRMFRSDGYGAVAAIFLALSPAHFMLSRMAVSLLLPLPFTLVWLVYLTSFTNDERLGTLGAAAFALGAGVYGYLASVILMPVYLLCSAWIAWGRDNIRIRRMAVLAGGFLIAVVPLVAWELAHPTRFSEMIAIYHPYAPRFGPLQGLKEMLSYFSLGVRSASYWANLNPSLLFFEGDSSLMLATRLAGTFLWPFAIFLIAGVYQIFTTRRSRLTLVLLIGFVTAPLPQVLTNDIGIRRSLVLVVFGALIGTYGVECLLSRSRRALVRIGAVAMLVMLPFSFRTFYRDYVGDYQDRAASWFGNNNRGMAERLMALRPSSSPIYLSNKVPYLDDYWPFYADMHGRQDLVRETHYYTPDDIDRLSAPTRSLLVAPAGGTPSDAALTALGWSAVTTVAEPTGQRVFVIYERR
jgi:4-amino-4-deoxy-L-arabinose transferase-like glycosyltransferase